MARGTGLILEVNVSDILSSPKRGKCTTMFKVSNWNFGNKNDITFFK